ncbi:MAG: prepilin-type N-terminal cleavage/methylation domain-containing protein, partial [Motiliproteus sp.]
MNATLDQRVPGSSPASGFTLLELLLVLTIAAMLLVLVPLSFSKGVEQFQGQSSLRDLLTTLAKARSQAINQQ